MGRDFLKNTGKILTAVILILIASNAAYAAEIRTELSRNRIPAGDSTTLKVMISGSTSDIRPLRVPAINGLVISLSGTSRSFQFINGKSWTGIILSFTIQAEKKGVYRVPPFIIEADGEKLQTGEFVITVDEGESESTASFGILRGEVELTASDIYAGEPVIMRYYLKTDSSNIRVEGMREQPESKGFLIKHIKEGESEAGEDKGNGRIYLASYCLVAAESGRHEIGGGALSVITETGGGFFSRVVRKDIRFPKKKVNVKALPLQDRPKDFKGDVGEFSIQSGEASGSFIEGEEIRIPVKVRGRGNLLMMSKLAVENQDGIRFLVEEKEPVLTIDNRTLAGEKDYIITVIPEKAGECHIGKITLPYFNPYTGIYQQAESLPLSFTVSPSASVKDSGETKSSGEEKNSWPAIIFIASLILIFGCWVILYLQTGKYRIVRADGLHNDQKVETEPSAFDHIQILREEFEKSYAERHKDLFLQKSEKIAGMVADERKSTETDADLSKIKEMINIYRYGGALLTDEDMKRIYELIKKLT